jgi:hypothetical protein
MCFIVDVHNIIKSVERNHRFRGELRMSGTSHLSELLFKQLLISPKQCKSTLFLSKFAVDCCNL